MYTLKKFVWEISVNMCQYPGHTCLGLPDFQRSLELFVSIRNILLASWTILGFPSRVAIADAPDFRGVITQPSSPFKVGNRAQLFIDCVLVRETQNVSFTQHQGKKHPRNPLLVADRTWEG